MEDRLSLKEVLRNWRW